MPTYRPFTQRDVDTWKRLHERDRPAPITEADLEAMPWVSSFVPAALENAMAVRFHLDGGKIVDLVINPVLAGHLVNCITEQGKQAGWINADDELVIPPPRPLDG